jgi:chemotaxis response regulator CheB
MPHSERVLTDAPGRSCDVATLTVDDHATFRGTLRQLVAAARGFVLVGEACSGEAAVREDDRLSPLLVLMDVAMPGIGGIAATRTIIRRHPALLVVLISVDDPAIHPDARALGKAVLSVRKQDLRPDGLRQLWEMHRKAHLHAASSTE